jgi:outer membrane protein assembly factor BamB
VLDLRSGRFIGSEFPSDIAELFPDFSGDTVFAATEDRRVVAIDTSTLERRDFEITGLPGKPLSVVASPDGSRVAVTLWNQEQSEYETRVHDGHTGELLASGLPRVFAMAFVTDDVLASSGSSDITLRQVDTLEAVGELPSNASGTTYMTVSDDGRTLLSQGRGPRGLILVDTEIGRQLGDPAPGDGRHAWLAPTGDAYARDAATGVQVWTLDVADQARAACALAGRELTRSEWDTYMTEAGPQRDTCAGLADG